MHLELVEPQRIIVEHLRQHKNALVLVGMGIGKSAAVLTRLSEMLLNLDIVGALIIAPLRVTNLTWPAEVRDWDQFSWMRVANLRTEAGQRAFLNGSAHIYLINWDAMNLLVSLVERRGKKELPFNVCVFDELTKAKNPSSKRVQMFRRKIPRVEHNWGLTGSILPNSHIDIFAQVRLIDGGDRLGTNYHQFLREHFYKAAYQFAPWKEKKGAGVTIEKKINDITCTLKSIDWLKIPDTVFEDVEITFDAELKEKYETLEKELVIQLRKDKVMNVASAAALVTKLLQYTSGHMYDEEKQVHPVHNLKFDALAKLAKKEKQPLLVACIFQHEQDRIRSQFPQARFFADAKSIRDQEKMIADWNSGKIRMLVAHPASCGHGLNLQHGSSVMVWLTLTYSREYYEQMIARLARRGQEEVIKIYRLMVPGTIDDAVAEALATKAENESRLISALQMLESYRKQS